MLKKVEQEIKALVRIKNFGLLHVEKLQTFEEEQNLAKVPKNATRIYLIVSRHWYENSLERAISGYYEVYLPNKGARLYSCAQECYESAGPGRMMVTGVIDTRECFFEKGLTVGIYGRWYKVDLPKTEVFRHNF
jgi:hypothetical protein